MQIGDVRRRRSAVGCTRVRRRVAAMHAVRDGRGRRLSVIGMVRVLQRHPHARRGTPDPLQDQDEGKQHA